MGLFCSFYRSLMAFILCSLACNEVLFCNAVDSWLDYEEPSDSFSERTITIKMPGTRPLKRDTYLCTAVQLAPQKQYIVHFEPSASQKTAHHMLLFGCSLPGSSSPSWDCGNGPYMECLDGQKIIFAWAKDAPPKYLPKGQAAVTVYVADDNGEFAVGEAILDIIQYVGFAIGGDSGIKYLVLQVHYASVDAFQEGSKDYSGFVLHTRQHSLPYLGGIYLLWAYSGSIPPDTSDVHVDVACKYEKSEPMFAFAFRTHAHNLAKVITGYRIRDGVWTLLGKGDPQAPQAFYPMDSTFEIKRGDILAARCTYDSRGHDLHHVVHMGASGHDEMCNFYIMYYSSAVRLKYSGGSCGEQNHPEIFKDFPIGSDTPLVHSPGLKPTSDHVTIPSTVHSKISSTLSAEESEQLTVPVEMSTEPAKLDKVHEGGVSKSKDGRDEFALSSSSTSQEGHVSVAVSTKAMSQGISHVLSSPTSKSIDSLQTVSRPVAGSTVVPYEPVRPVTQPVADEHHASKLHVVSDWPSLTALQKSKLGQVTGVSLDSKGQVIVFHHGSRTWDDSTFDSSNVFRNADVVGTISEHTVWIIDSVTGKVKGFWGKNLFYLPHGLTIDHEDNLWLTDVGSHQVFKFSPLSDRTQRLLALGDKLVPGSDNSRFCKPTSVAVDKSGEFFVADGYCNSRILKFSAAGKLLNTWGTPSYAGPGLPAPGSFFIPHGLALDSKKHKLYVADRENGRVQVFSSISGTFVDEIDLPEFGGLVYAVDYNDREQGGVLHVVNGPNRGDQKREVPVQGFTIRVADKNLLQKWPSEKEEVLTQPHDLVSSADGTEVYVVETGPNRVWKLSSKQQPSVTTPVYIVPVVTNEQLSTRPEQDIHGDKMPTKASNHGPVTLDLVDEKASMIPAGRQDSTGPSETDLTTEQGGTEEKSSVNPDNHQDSNGPGTEDLDSQSTDDHLHPTDEEVENKGPNITDRLNPSESIHPSKHNASTGPDKSKPTTQSSVMWVDVTKNANRPSAAGSVNNSSRSGARNDAVDDSDDDEDSVNITAGVIPALVILSVLAVPIVFLLLISITLRIRAYRRDKRSHMNGFHEGRKDFSVGRTRGWWSYMNCCDRQKYKFNRVTLQDFYSDSDSDGV